MNNKSKKLIIPAIGRLRGFTLVELLLVIAIITVLSSMALGVMRQAQYDAKEAATQSRITQIEAMMQVVMEDYEVRRMPVDLRSIATSRTEAKNIRYQIIAELLDAELPRPYFYNNGSVAGYPGYFWSSNANFYTSPDLPQGPGYVPAVPTPTPPPFPPSAKFIPIGNYRPGLLLDSIDPPKSALLEYWRRSSGKDFDLPGEYLYQFLFSVNFDGQPGTEALGNQAIGDSDGDQILEVLDAFGEPLLFEIQQRADVTQDTDQDGEPDVEDDDDDGDGILDVHDLDNDGNGIPDSRDEGGAFDLLRLDDFFNPTDPSYQPPRTRDIRIVVFSRRLND